MKKDDKENTGNVVSIFTGRAAGVEEMQLPPSLIIMQALNKQSFNRDMETVVADLLMSIKNSGMFVMQQANVQDITVEHLTLGLPCYMPREVWHEIVTALSHMAKEEDFPAYIRMVRQLGDETLERFHRTGAIDSAIPYEQVMDVFGCNIFAQTTLYGSTAAAVKRAFPDFEIKPFIFENKDRIISLSIKMSLPAALIQQGKDMRDYLQAYLDRKKKPVFKLVTAPVTDPAP